MKRKEQYLLSVRLPSLIEVLTSKRLAKIITSLLLIALLLYAGFLKFQLNSSQKLLREMAKNYNEAPKAEAFLLYNLEINRSILVELFFILD